MEVKHLQFKQIDQHLQSIVKSTRFCQFHDINCSGKKVKLLHN